MQATRFEFEKRLWIIFAIFFVGFALSNFDHTGFLSAVQRLIAPSAPSGSSAAIDIRRLIVGAGALLVFAAAALRTWAAAYLHTDIVHDTGQHSDALVADGPFRYVRNPLYLANPIMAVGIGVLASRAGFIFLVAANWFFVYRLIFREEASLLASQGESYRAYCRAVPRFLPAPRPRVAASGRIAQWGQAFTGESFIWIFGIAELVLAFTLNTRLSLIVFAVGFAAHFLVLGRVRKHAAEAAVKN